MALTFDQLITDKTAEELRDQLLLALRGVGYVKKTGYGTGSLLLDGSAADAASLRFKIIATGALGSATYQLSEDGGVTYGSTTTMPSSGLVDLTTDHGVTCTFQSGPVGGGDSFAAGDTYSFELTVPRIQSTSWQPGSVPLTIVEKDAEANEDFSRTIKSFAKGGYLSTAENDWLDLWLEEMYGTERVAGETAVGTIVLTDVAAAGPFTIVPGQLWVGTALGVRFTNTNGGTLALSGTLQLTVRAEKPGAEYNVGNDAVVVLFTSLPGVTVNNPGPGSGVTWLTTQGRNRETDFDGKARAKLRWPSLAVGSETEDVYALWARTASANVTRTLVKPDDVVAGKVNVIIAGPSGGVDGATVTAVDDYIQPRVPLVSLAEVSSAVNQTITIAGTLYVKSGYAAAAAAAVATNLGALFGGGKNSISEELPGIEIEGVVYLSQIIEQLMLAEGARNASITINAGTADITLDPLEVAVQNTAGLSIVEV